MAIEALLVVIAAAALLGVLLYVAQRSPGRRRGEDPDKPLSLVRDESDIVLGAHDSEGRFTEPARVSDDAPAPRA